LTIILKYKDMETLTFNTNYANNSYSNSDVLSAFKETTEKNLNIHQGMSVKEISEIVSEKIITIVREQFEATKTNLATI
jgi:serine/threonine protein phosphatase PrpC